jgi:hypothetical protein
MSRKQQPALIAPNTDENANAKTENSTIGRKVRGLRAYLQGDVAAPPAFRSLAELIATTQALALDVERAKLTTAQAHLAAALAAYVRRRQSGEERKALADAMGPGQSGDYMRSAVKAALDAHAARFADGREADAHDTDAALIAQAIAYARGVNPHAIAIERAQARKAEREANGEAQHKPRKGPALGQALGQIPYGSLNASEAATMSKHAIERLAYLSSAQPDQGVTAEEAQIAAKALEALALALAPFAASQKSAKAQSARKALTR